MSSIYNHSQVHTSHLNLQALKNKIIGGSMSRKEGSTYKTKIMNQTSWSINFDTIQQKLNINMYNIWDDSWELNLDEFWATSTLHKQLIQTISCQAKLLNKLWAK